MSQNAAPAIRGESLSRANRSRLTLLIFSIEKVSSGILWLSLTLIVIEGAIRKWVIGTEASALSYLAFFSKDIVFSALLFFPIRNNVSDVLDVFRKYLIYGGALLGIGFFSSSIQGVNFVGAGLTLRSTIILPLLALWVIPRIKGVSLNRGALVIALLTIVNCILAIAQNRLPADHELNRYVVSESTIVYLDTGVRATGTFSYITGLGVLSTVGIWSGMVLISLSSNLRLRMIGWMALLAGFGCALSAVTRSAMLIGIVMLLAWLPFSKAVLSSAWRSITAGILVLGIIVFSGLFPIFAELTEGLLERHENAGDTFEDRVFGQIFGEGLSAIDIAPFGNGFGTEQIGGNYATAGEMRFTTFETQFGRLVMEGGVIGLTGFLIICIGAITTLQLAKRQVQQSSDKAALLATQIMLVMLFATNVVFNHTASAFAWIIFAVVLASSLHQVDISKFQPDTSDALRGQL